MVLAPFSSPAWCYASVAALASSLISVPLNGFVLLSFLRDRHLQTPFGVYIIILMISNLAWVIFKQTLDIINNLYFYYWWLGEPLCKMYKYGTYVYSGVILYLHVLITANRIWAITFPVAYRNYHSKQTAAILCLAVVVFVNVVALPAYIVDLSYYALPATIGCYIDIISVWGWLFLAQVVVYDLPVIFVAAAYPWLLIQYKTQRRTDLHRLETLAKGPTGTTKRMLKIEAAGSSGYASDSREAPPPPPGEKFKGPATVRLPASEGATKPRRRRVSSRAFLVISFLTASIIVCWGPTQVYTTIMMFTLQENKTADEVCFVLYVVQSVVDPIAFIFVLRDLRQSVHDRLRRWARVFRCV
ncbi:cysteinyl leukotriene receptor 1-like [Paramacrobiotus metropolitanus]|uniref:cysteinyl leukotriene receptor 1-like n=1 Tax=Paramacrobiotus metropolitanus TaxID=2943436 RepID=UPI002445A524|nr:cysteinyl leukotriene receptor 1-like [Paramacrobiotus metropolitanus]